MSKFFRYQNVKLSFRRVSQLILSALLLTTKAHPFAPSNGAYRFLASGASLSECACILGDQNACRGQQSNQNPEKQFNFMPHLGTMVPALPEWNLESGVEVRLLSDGAQNLASKGNMGQIYVIDPNGSNPYVLKVYTTEWHMRSDLDTLSFLRKCLQTRNSKSDFLVVDAAIFEKNTLRLSYTRGRDLEHLLSDPEIPHSLKVRLTHLYRDRLERLARQIKLEAPTESELFIETDPSLKSIDDEGRLVPLRMAILPVHHSGIETTSEVRILIKPRQVIVDPVSLEMTIVDPY